MPLQNLKVMLLPLNIAAASPQLNLERVEQRITSLREDIDLIVLPELSLTGFTHKREVLEPIAEPNDGKSIKQLMRMASEANAAIWGGFLAKENGKLYNRGFMIMPGTDPLFYDKRHLFAGAESQIMERGEALPPTVEFRSWRIRMSLCYDIRFPVWNRNVNLDYDLLVVPANWPHSRFYAWEQMIKARAIENQVFVAACDREGADEYGEYQRGDSMIVDHWGKPISIAAPDGSIYAELSTEDITRARTRFTPYLDADNFQLLGV